MSKLERQSMHSLPKLFQIRAPEEGRSLFRMRNEVFSLSRLHTRSKSTSQSLEVAVDTAWLLTHRNVISYSNKLRPSLGSKRKAILTWPFNSGATTTPCVHTRLSYKPPAPEVFLPIISDWPAAHNLRATPARRL